MLSFKKVSEDEFFEILKERKAYSPEYWETDTFDDKTSDSVPVLSGGPVKLEPTKPAPAPKTVSKVPSKGDPDFKELVNELTR